MRLLLQRRAQGDASKWRTLGTVGLEALDATFKASDALARLLPDIVAMRIVPDGPAPAVAVWSWGHGWALS